jgi:beta-glucosidase
LKNLSKFKKPIYILENGLADSVDKFRKDFIKEHLVWIHKAIEEKIDVKGYFHWSLIDNFEWDRGFWPRFGLIEINYQNLERKPRPSAFYYAKICKENCLEINN